jgi:hypothetical protein
MPRERVVVATPSPPQPLAATLPLPLSSPSEVARVATSVTRPASVAPRRGSVRRTTVLVGVVVMASVLTVAAVLRAVVVHDAPRPSAAPSKSAPLIGE